MGLNNTAAITKDAPRTAAAFSPLVSATVLRFLDLSPSTSAMPFTTSLPRFEMPARSASVTASVSGMPAAIAEPKRKGAATVELTAAFPGSPVGLRRRL